MKAMKIKYVFYNNCSGQLLNKYILNCEVGVRSLFSSCAQLKFMFTALVKKLCYESALECSSWRYFNEKNILNITLFTETEVLLQEPIAINS